MNEYEDRPVLEREVAYAGDPISVKLLEEMIEAERQRQNSQIDELEVMRRKNAEVQQALAEEMEKLRQLSEKLNAQRGKKRGFLRNILSSLPWFKEDAFGRRSIEELLRNQYEMSSLRLQQATNLADRLEAATQDLYEEIERLNEKIVESAENEERAAAYVKDLRQLKEGLEANLMTVDGSSAEGRHLQRELDRTRQKLAEHTTKLKLYSTAEERLAKLRENTRRLAETINNLQSDITRYVVVASEKLDLIGGQIQAIGAAADASVAMLELQQSLEVMTESVNHATRFVAETQAYFRENVDQMIDNLRLYDEETQRVLDENLIYTEAFNEVDVERALASSFEKRLAAAQAGKEDDGSTAGR